MTVCTWYSKIPLSSTICMGGFISFLLSLYSTPTPWNHQFGFICMFYLSDLTWLICIIIFSAHFYSYKWCHVMYLIVFQIIFLGTMLLRTICIAMRTFNPFLLTAVYFPTTALLNRTSFGSFISGTVLYLYYPKQ